MTQKQIEQINSECPYEQGIFVEPFGIPTHIKEPVLYMRFEIGGVSGGSCWDSSNPQSYTVSEKPEFVVLDKTLKLLKPNISYLDYKKIDEYVIKDYNTDYEYYGNYTNYEIWYLKLSDLLIQLES
jgi:hypothetical protein